MRIVILTIALVFFVFTDSRCQNEDFDTFNRQHWKEITKDIDYSPDKKELKKKERESKGNVRSKGGSIFPAGGQFLQIIVIAVFIIILIVVISKLAGNNLRIKAKHKGGDMQQKLEDIEQNLMESDLMQWLKKVVEDKNYRLALRIYYLIIIKELATKGLINWKKEKTNMDYLYEMRGHNTYDRFEEVTGIYQLIWYGEKNMGDQYLVEMSHKFKSYYQSINQYDNG
ncbi:hypothetical protein JMN32_04570 [Fulvivirga sp. 29W222]|uniref:DUF4129 domain-containing protein n=1 Tax=Fulvivirga marina TaxID=2494733 RepID=A0A937FTR2_9BACT|nr:hypothetical protein [Fulvivirga marina]MBL6445569.1 hypothetical protein [Fulvivirga marina]